MNDKQKDFLKNNFGIHHFPLPHEQMYKDIKEEQEKKYEEIKTIIEQPKNSRKRLAKHIFKDLDQIDGFGKYGNFWKKLNNGKTVYNNENFLEGKNILTLKQHAYNNNIESLAVIGKAFESMELHTNKGIKKYDFDKSYIHGYSVTWFNIDFSIEMSKIVIHFEHKILDPVVIPIETVIKEKEIVEEPKPEIEHKHSQGENLVNIRYKHIYDDDSINVFIDLYDNDKDYMGTYKADSTMRFIAITNLAYGTYYYKISQYNKDVLIQSTELTEFKITSSVMAVKPLR